jgi:hypothetical protein
MPKPRDTSASRASEQHRKARLFQIRLAVMESANRSAFEAFVRGDYANAERLARRKESE